MNIERSKIKTLLVAAAGDQEATIAVWARARPGAEWRLTHSVKADFTDASGRLLSVEQRGQRLKELTGAAKQSFKAQHNMLVLPRQTVTLRQSTLPSTDDAELEKMARFEAEKQIPFNAERHIVTHHVLEKQGIGGSLALIGAIDRTVLEQYLAPFTAAGIYFQEALVSSQALYNLFPLTPQAANESSMILHIGRQYSDLLIMYQNRLEFSRSLALGWDGMLKQLQERVPGFVFESLAEVDALEPERFFEGAEMLSGAAAAGADGSGREGADGTETAPQIMRRAAKKILSEIKRTWDFAQREKTFPPLTRIYLSGAAPLWKNLAEYLQLNTGCEAHNLADTFAGHAIAVNGAMAAEAPLWAPEIGAVAQTGHPQPLMLNLLPRDYLQQQISEKQLKQLLIIGGLALVWLLSGFLLYQKIQSNQHKTYVQYQAAIGELEKRAKKLADDENKLSILEKNTNDERSALMILDQLNTFESIPEKVTLLYYDFKRNKELVLKGHAHTIPDINNFVAELRTSGLFEVVELSNQSSDRLKGREERIYKFDILCKFPLVTDSEGGGRHQP